MKTTVDVTPNFDRMFAQFNRDAKVQGEFIQRNMLPGKLNDARRLEALRTVQALLAPLNIAAQSMTTVKAVEEFRETINEVTKAVVAAADKLENELLLRDSGEEVNDEDIEDDVDVAQI